MSRLGARFAVLVASFLVFLLLLTSSAFGAQKKHPRKPAKKAEPAVVVPAVPSGPLPQLTLSQMPALPPSVEFHGQQLTIVAQNSSLGDILRAVRNQTGASVDIPSNANERVVGHFGPGPAREVLASLLEGVNFNYIVLGSPSDPQAVARVILTPKPTGPAATGSHVAYTPPPTPQPEPQAEEPAEDNSEPDTAAAAPAQPEEGAADANNGQPANGQAPNGQPAIRTPEQLLQELQRQQQQLLRPQQPGAPGAAVPPGETAQPQE
jgi:hypothetical protein